MPRRRWMPCWSLSTLASTPLEEVARVGRQAGPGGRWFQLYLQGDRGVSRHLVERAAASGYEAIVLTVDAPVNGVRNREQRAGFALPAGVTSANLDPYPVPPGARSGDGAEPHFRPAHGPGRRPGTTWNGCAAAPTCPSW